MTTVNTPNAVSESSNEKFSRLLDDRPAENDYLDFQAYVETISALSLNSHTSTPLTIGIFGRWGTGKTTLMRKLEITFEKHGISTIWFNAWQYGNEDELWAAFLQSLLNKIGAKFSFWQRLTTNWNLFVKRMDWGALLSGISKYILRALVVILPLLFLDPITSELQPGVRDLVKAGGNVAILGIAVYIVLRPFLELIQKSVTIDFNAFRQESDFQAHIAFLDKFRDHFSDIVQSLPSKKEIPLAVFIDDLDRCAPDKVLHVLDAIKLFMDIPGCIFVLGLDSDVVQQAIATKYPNDTVARREYLSKIVQLPFQLPPLVRSEMTLFLDELKLSWPDPLCKDVFITGLVVNPREIKRTINIFVLLWNLSKRRNKLEDKINAVRLAKIVVIQHGYPELHRLLQQQPSLLIYLEKYFLDQVEQEQREEKSVELEMLVSEIRKALLLLEDVFSNNQSLRSVFIDNRLDRWRSEVPDGNSVAQRIDNTIVFLEGQYDDEGTNGLVQFLIVCSERLDQNDSQHERLKHLAARFSKLKDRQGKVPSSIRLFTQNETLRSMLVLKPTAASLSEALSDTQFGTLSPSEIGVYFTLTSRVEATSAPLSPRGNYEIISEIGGGYASEVYQAVDRVNSRRVVLKILSKSILLDSDMKNVFEEQVKTLKELHHPNLVPIYDYGYDEVTGHSFYVTKHMQGSNIKQRLKRSGRFSIEEVKQISLVTLNALRKIHEKGIIHLDIKPTTVLFDGYFQPYLSVARVPGSRQAHGQLSIVSNPEYMAPELDDNKPASQSADLYSLGVTLYEALTGVHPYGRSPDAKLNDVQPVHEVRPETPPSFSEFIMKLLVKDPSKRYQSSQEAYEALERTGR